MNIFEVRRTRVRPEFAWLYPEIEPGVWMSAKKAALWVERAKKGRRGDAPCSRVLPDIHFEFRGGVRTDRNTAGRLSQRAVLTA